MEIIFIRDTFIDHNHFCNNVAPVLVHFIEKYKSLTLLLSYHCTMSLINFIINGLCFTPKLIGVSQSQHTRCKGNRDLFLLNSNTIHISNSQICQMPNLGQQHL